MTDEKRRRFEHWLEYMPSALTEWRATLPEELERQLDGSVRSLDFLEGWMLERYPDEASAEASGEIDTMDGCVRYVGEVYRRIYGGDWDIELSDPNNFIYGIPHIKGFKRAGPPIVLLDICFNALHQRTGEYFRFISKSLG